MSEISKTNRFSLFFLIVKKVNYVTFVIVSSLIKSGWTHFCCFFSSQIIFHEKFKDCFWTCENKKFLHLPWVKYVCYRWPINDDNNDGVEQRLIEKLLTVIILLLLVKKKHFKHFSLGDTMCVFCNSDLYFIFFICEGYSCQEINGLNSTERHQILYLQV